MSRDTPRAEDMTLRGLLGIAAEIDTHIEAQEFAGNPRTRQVIALAEEAGEFVGAARRYMGMARRSGPIEDVEAELADLVITAFVTAVPFGVDLPHRHLEETGNHIQPRVEGTPMSGRFWYDTEFLEDGQTIELISIGIVGDERGTT